MLIYNSSKSGNQLYVRHVRLCWDGKMPELYLVRAGTFWNLCPILKIIIILYVTHLSTYL